MSDYKTALIEKFQKKTATVAIMGLGYVGLPLAVVFAKAGYQVIGYDLVQEKVDLVNSGKSYILDVPDEDLRPLVMNLQVRATSNPAELAKADAVAICVPTPLRKTGDPDMSFIVSATEGLAPYVHPGMVISMESSTYPGTTREVLLPRLVEERGLKVGEDVFITFSPERVDPGREDWTTYNTPKVLGGITDACTQVGTAWYEQALETIVPVSSTEVAEMTKLLENTFRMINIGLVNELAIMCHHLGIDVWEVVDAAATKPFGFMKFTPGPGLGGHCIPIDPLYLSWKLRSLNYNARFIDLASEINTQMPRFVHRKIQDALNAVKKPLNGATVLLLGVAYKPNVDDMRESPALDVIHLLQASGAQVSYHDPYVPAFDHDGLAMRSIENLIETITAVDCVVITTNHRDYDYAAILNAANLIVDTRNGLGELGINNPKVVRL
jgi:UDP-N-acetyl-D-glucosamine dehydrogenase